MRVKYTKEKLEEAVKNANSVADVLRFFNETGNPEEINARDKTAKERIVNSTALFNNIIQG